MNCRVQLSVDEVRRDVLRQLGIQDQDMGVKRLSTAMFFLHFSTPERRTATLRLGGLYAGQTALRLLPWTRQVNASANKLMFRARVCLEGIPEHAQQLETIAKLFNAPSFIEAVDTEYENDQERACMCVWIWTANPDGLATTASMQIAEPITFPEEFYWQMGDVELPTTRSAPADMLEYQVIIHLDRVHDYSPLPSSLSHESMHSGISGLPDDLEEAEWPVKHRFVWLYGVPDNRIPPRRRPSVHERIGTRRDRSLQEVLEEEGGEPCNSLPQIFMTSGRQA